MGNDKEVFMLVCLLNICNMVGINVDGILFIVVFSVLNDDICVLLDVFFFFLQDEIELFEYFDLVLGVCFDSFDIEVFNVKVDENFSCKDDQVFLCVGLIYKFQENILVYVSYSELFLFCSGEQYIDINGSKSQLDLDIYSNQEIGLKWDFV